MLSDGRILSGSNDNMIRIWNADTGETVQIINNSDDGYSDFTVQLKHFSGEMICDYYPSVDTDMCGLVSSPDGINVIISSSNIVHFFKCRIHDSIAI